MKKNNLYILVIGLSLAGYLWLAWNVFESASLHAPTTTCIWKGITHLPCPSCGTTRSLVLLVKGHVAESLLVNPFGVILALALTIIPFWIIADTFRKSDSFFRWYVSAEHLLVKNMWISIPAIAVVVLNWCWNIMKGL
jgi:hypothetical protein